MNIREDRSHLSDIDLLSIEKGIAKLGIYSIKFDVYLTEEEKQENRSESYVLTSEQWNTRCEQHKKEVSQKIEKIINLIHSNFVIYQYKNENIDYSKDDWDLFFWCNGSDMSYVTLNPNKKRTTEQQVKDINNVLKLIKGIDTNIEVAIQYTTDYDKEKVKAIATAHYQTIKNKFINYMGLGRIKEVGTSQDGSTRYGFFKKGASRNYYQLSDIALLGMTLKSE